MRALSLLVVLLLSLSGCGEKQEKKIADRDFETLMGNEFPAWAHVQTKEDYENLKIFRKVYESNLPELSIPHGDLKIPKVLHFIWMGPKPFPKDSVENVRTWMGKNPSWTVYFWTDNEARPLPHPDMKKRLIKDFKFLELEECFYKSDNWGEKSDILRYEILYQEGGVYVDHDVKCFASFDSLNAAYDFYCGLEMPFKTPLSTTVLPTNNLVGSRANHPVLRQCMCWLKANWDQIERDYPGKDRESVINRVSHRTFFVLGDTMKRIGNTAGNRDMVFPAFYFNAPNEKLAILARHEYAGQWYENESKFEKHTRERLMYISKKANKTILFVGLLTGLNLCGFGFLYVLIKKRKEI